MLIYMKISYINYTIPESPRSENSKKKILIEKPVYLSVIAMIPSFPPQPYFDYSYKALCQVVNLFGK